jgi:hypothetical protein
LGSKANLTTFASFGGLRLASHPTLTALGTEATFASCGGYGWQAISLSQLWDLRPTSHPWPPSEGYGWQAILLS